jgi:hypothetical protein
MFEAIVQHIANNIPSLVISENLFANYYPDEPNNIVSVISLGGFPPSKYDGTREPIFEIKLRNERYIDGNDLANQIMNLFHSKENYLVGSFFVLHSYAMTEVNYLYNDSNNRREFSLELAFLIKNN